MPKTILSFYNYSLDKYFFVCCSFLSSDYLFVQMEVENHVITIALMPLAESRDNILICTAVCR